LIKAAILFAGSQNHVFELCTAFEFTAGDELMLC